MKDLNILVTGGAGYIGSHACKTLRRLGYTPVTIDNLSIGWNEAVKYGPFENCNLLDKLKLDYVFKKYSPIAVFHFAALSQVGESMKFPNLYWENNVMGSLNLMQAAVTNGCMNFVFSSTCAIFGDQDNVILDEESVQLPKNAYASSKRAVENMLADYNAAFGLNYVSFRYFNVAGADSDAEIGEYHRPETHLIPLILDVAEGKKDAITIFGTDYATYDGTCIRDYVHVCDLVDAHVSGLNWLLGGNRSRVYNLGSGNGFTVREVIDQVKRITGKEVPIIEGKRRHGDCAKLVSGSQRALKELGWSADRSDLERMIKDAWRWQKTGGYNK